MTGTRQESKSGVQQEELANSTVSNTAENNTVNSTASTENRELNGVANESVQVANEADKPGKESENTPANQETTVATAEGEPSNEQKTDVSDEIRDLSAPSYNEGVKEKDNSEADQNPSGEKVVTEKSSDQTPKETPEKNEESSTENKEKEKKNNEVEKEAVQQEKPAEESSGPGKSVADEPSITAPNEPTHATPTAKRDPDAFIADTPTENLKRQKTNEN